MVFKEIAHICPPLSEIGPDYFDACREAVFKNATLGDAEAFARVLNVLNVERAALAYDLAKLAIDLSSHTADAEHREKLRYVATYVAEMADAARHEKGAFFKMVGG